MLLDKDKVVGGIRQKAYAQQTISAWQPVVRPTIIISAIAVLSALCIGL
ncbi:hypothetical protein GNI_069590, partial [Gregarina niphandrodes]